MTQKTAITGILLVLFLSACSGFASVLPEQESEIPTGKAPTWPQGQIADAQGPVTILVTPLALSTESETLDFEISLDTHSVDLTMDLTALASLSTDTGLTIDASTWNGLTGGHHISGILSFPARIGGQRLLDGVHRITLTIQDIDGADRAFTWSNE
ncbi:MAG: hypothetical protein WEA61_08305 [Anaerolineales bacterium]